MNRTTCLLGAMLVPFGFSLADGAVRADDLRPPALERVEITPRGVERSSVRFSGRDLAIAVNSPDLQIG